MCHIYYQDVLYFTHVNNIMKRKPECLYIVKKSISLATELSIEHVTFIQPVNDRELYIELVDDDTPTGNNELIDRFVVPITGDSERIMF